MTYIKKNKFHESIGIFIISFIIVIFLYNNSFIYNHTSNTFVNEIEKFNNSSDDKHRANLIFPKNKDLFYIIENDFLRLKFCNQGMQIKDVIIKNHQDCNLNSNLYLIKNNSLSYGYIFNIINRYRIDTRQLYFTPILKIKNKQFTKVIMRSKINNNCFIDFVFILDKYYCLKHYVKTYGLYNILGKHVDRVKFFYIQNILSLEKNKDWEKNYTNVYYSHKGNIKCLSKAYKNQVLSLNNINWIANKQQFFSSIILFNNHIKDSFFNINSQLVKDSHKMEIIKTNYIEGVIPINKLNKEFFFSTKFYFLPLEYNLLQIYNYDFSKLIPLGWGFLRMINTHFFLPIFEFLSATKLNYGLIIVLMTIIVKLCLLRILYNQYKLNVMMKVIKPDIDIINKKYADNSIKKQKLLLELYKQAGINPMSGLLPIILQLPIFYSLFKFFPSIINLRGKSFLWVNDLTSYDSILHLPFRIPIYGDHVSLFTLLYILSLLLHTYISNNDGIMNNSKNNFNYLIYIMPIFMLTFINNYSSGLSLYYLVSNIFNIIVYILIKKFIIHEYTIREVIEKNKCKYKIKNIKCE